MWYFWSVIPSVIPSVISSAIPSVIPSVISSVILPVITSMLPLGNLMVLSWFSMSRARWGWSRAGFEYAETFHDCPGGIWDLDLSMLRRPITVLETSWVVLRWF